MKQHKLLLILLVAILTFARASDQGESALVSAAYASFKKADDMAEAGKSAQSKQQFQETLDILHKLRSQGPTSIEIDALRAQTLLMKASVMVDLREKADAKPLFNAAISAYDELAKRDPKDPRWAAGAKVARDTLRNIDTFK